MNRYATALACASALLTTAAPVAQERTEPTVIEGRVADATEDAPPPRVSVRYEEYGVDHQPVTTRTEEDGGFRFELPDNLGRLGLLSVREPGYNLAVRSWPRIDDPIVLRLTKPIPIYGRLVNASGLPVSDARLKWRVEHDNRLTSGTIAATSDGFFNGLVPNDSDTLRLVAWQSEVKVLGVQIAG